MIKEFQKKRNRSFDSGPVPEKYLRPSKQLVFQQ